MDFKWCLYRSYHPMLLVRLQHIVGLAYNACGKPFRLSTGLSSGIWELSSGKTSVHGFVLHFPDCLVLLHSTLDKHLHLKGIAGKEASLLALMCRFGHILRILPFCMLGSYCNLCLLWWFTICWSVLFRLSYALWGGWAFWRHGQVLCLYVITYSSRVAFILWIKYNRNMVSRVLETLIIWTRFYIRNTRTDMSEDETRKENAARQ